MARYNHPLYSTWKKMRLRCLSKVNPAYHWYGGRGITICSQWDDFYQFLKDMGDKPSKKHSLDRIDTNGNYEPSNCRWTTAKVQANNRRDNRLFVHEGKNLPLWAWAEEIGIKRSTLSMRIYQYGWNLERALTTTVSHHE